MPGSLDSMYSSYFKLENIWQHHFAWSGPNSPEIMNFIPIVGPLGPELNWNKFTISCEFGPLQEKRWCHMFSSIKMDEYMEPEHSGIFWAKMVAKLLRSPGIHFMHIRVNNSKIADILNFYLDIPIDTLNLFSSSTHVEAISDILRSESPKFLPQIILWPKLGPKWSFLF